MKVSVLTAAYNAAPTIARTIESFLAQSHPDKELIVIDGASSDGTAECAAAYAAAHDAVRLLSEPDRGMYDALNKGLGLYGGAAVGALNADDAYEGPDTLGRIAEALEKADIVYGDLDFVAADGSGRVVRRWRSGARPASGFRGGWMPAHPTFYVRRRVAEAVGPFDLSFATASDYDYMMRAVELYGFRAAHIPAVLIHMQQGGQSTASLRSHVSHNLEAARARRRRLGTPRFDPALVLKPARKVRQFFAR